MSYNKYTEKKTQAVLMLKMRELSEKYNIPVEDIESICNAPFELFKIKKDEASFNNVDFPTFKIPFFVTFYVTNGKKEFIKNNVCKKDE